MNNIYGVSYFELLEQLCNAQRNTLVSSTTVRHRKIHLMYQ